MVQAVVVIAIAAGFVAILLGRQGLAWWKYRGQRVIVCPENQLPAGVVVDARHAAASSLLGAPELRLAACSRWPAFGGGPFGAIEWPAARPALLQGDRISVEWSQIPAEKLAETLAVAQPVCSACHLANKMVREHPELVVDRSSAPAAEK